MNEKSDDDEISNKKHHFVLVHGFCYGAWSWYKLVTLLKSKGHKATALDLGGSGINSKNNISSFSDYVQPLMDFMANSLIEKDDDDEKVILGGHSYGGIPISLAMEYFPQNISLVVFITAYMPNFKDPHANLIHEFFKRSSAESFMDTKFVFDRGLENLPTSAVFGPEHMATKVYQHCALEDLELAKMLVRPSSFFLEDLDKKGLLSEERYGRVKRCYVVCEDDDVMDVKFQRYSIQNSRPNGVIFIAAAGHMPMISKTQELCYYLLELADKYY